MKRRANGFTEGQIFQNNKEIVGHVQPACQEFRFLLTSLSILPLLVVIKIVLNDTELEPRCHSKRGEA